MQSDLTTADEIGLEPVEPGYKNVLRVRMSVFWLILWVIGGYWIGPFWSLRR
ncbi:hypothetical protein H9L15_08460 [Sphingomonas daechungensis]|uniref:Uncharacterized protein n=1 Tax=Sphingomonas daechungensis TaxID=1176646 RepID=A0ABX6SXM8_9SPHN|nr:hypothetical protein [Sphingomonas daechungensis]QNP42356.1 hypothetical protein H9L15_08460 [Sphingomonas daechungensis]